jgi:ribonuclease I
MGQGQVEHGWGLRHAFVHGLWPERHGRWRAKGQGRDNGAQAWQ